MCTSSRGFCFIADACHPLPAIENGQIFYTTYGLSQADQVAFFTCNTGYVLIGFPFSQCVENPANQTTRIWDQPIPSCIGNVASWLHQWNKSSCCFGKVMFLLMFVCHRAGRPGLRLGRPHLDSPVPSL